MTAMPRASHNPGASRTTTTSELSPTLAPHVAKTQPTQSPNPAPHPSQEANKLQPKESGSSTQDGQIAFQDDPNDPDDGHSLYQSTGEYPRQSNDPEKPSNLIEPTDIRAPLPGSNHRHRPTQQESQVLPRPARSHKPTPQYDLKAADLLGLLRLLPSQPYSGRTDSTPDAPRSTRDSEKPMDHQGISLHPLTINSPSLVHENVITPLLGDLSVHRNIISPFSNLNPALDPNVLDHASEHIRVGNHPNTSPTPRSLPPALSGVSTTEGNVNHTIAASTEPETCTDKHVGTQPDQILSPISDSVVTGTNGVDASYVSNSIPTHNPSTIIEALPATPPGLFASPSRSSNLNTGNNNFSTISPESALSEGPGSSLAPQKPTIAGARNRTTVTSLAVFRGEGARLEGGDGWTLVARIAIVAIMALL